MLRTRVVEMLRLFWLITQDDFGTFVCPNTAFGVFGALAGPLLVTSLPNSSNSRGSPLASGLLRLTATIFFNWSTVLIFDLANQRRQESVREDALNKPWRPIPSGRATSSQLRRALLFAIPAVLSVNHFWLHVGVETALIFVVVWHYNDLGGGDESWVLRNVVIATAFGLFNLGSLKVASGSGSVGNGPATEAAGVVTPLGTLWIVAISGVILTTMHVQDLKDVAGDKSRGRQSAPLVLGENVARWTIALPVVFWSGVCPLIWGPPLWGLCIIIALGILVAYRCLTLSGTMEDRRTWQLWALWTAALYALPCMSEYDTN